MMNKYHKRFIESFASENVIALFSRYKGAAKEITESWAMLEAAKKVIDKMEDWDVVIVGDGCSPRTGAVFAYYTKADVLSIDPNFNLDHWFEHVDKQTDMGFEPQRLTLIKDKVENFKIDCDGRKCLVIWPHSHAVMGTEKISGYSDRIDIAMPCCVPIPRKMMEIPHMTYEDYNVESPKRTIHIWKNEKCYGNSK